MKWHKGYLRRPVNAEAIEAICKRYDELRSLLVANKEVLRSSQTDEDILHTAIMLVAQEETTGDLFERVRAKFYSLRYGLHKEERARAEVTDETGATERYGDHGDDKQEADQSFRVQRTTTRLHEEEG